MRLDVSNASNTPNTSDVSNASDTGLHASEAERVAIEDTQKWLMEAVIGLNLCPFAKAVVVKDKVRYRVCLSSAPQDVLEMLREELQFLATEIGRAHV